MGGGYDIEPNAGGRYEMEPNAVDYLERLDQESRELREVMCTRIKDKRTHEKDTA